MSCSVRMTTRRFASAIVRNNMSERSLRIFPTAFSRQMSLIRSLRSSPQPSDRHSPHQNQKRRLTGFVPVLGRTSSRSVWESNFVEPNLRPQAVCGYLPWVDCPILGFFRVPYYEVLWCPSIPVGNPQPENPPWVQTECR
jgi:hypothetical protein